MVLPKCLTVQSSLFRSNSECIFAFLSGYLLRDVVSDKFCMINPYVFEKLAV